MPIKGYEDQPRVFEGKYIQRDKVEAHVHEKMKPLLDKLLIEKPLWSFEVNNPDWAAAAYDLRVIEDGETLGTIRWTYHGTSYKYAVNNDRIRQKSARSQAYMTKEISKAIFRVKKDFYAETIGERVEKAAEQVGNLLDQGVRRKSSETSGAKNAVQRGAYSWVNNVAFPQFIQYLHEHDQTMYNTYIKGQELEQELHHVTHISNNWKNGNTILVLRNDSGYIMRDNNESQRVTDAELPNEVRMKLGMLKLVENEQFISGIGFKANEDAFVILKEKEE